MRPLTISALASPLGATGSARNATLSPSGGEGIGPARLLTLGKGTDPARPLTLTLSPSGGEGIDPARLLTLGKETDPARPLTLTLSPSGGEGIGAPSPSLRERAGV